MRSSLCFILILISPFAHSGDSFYEMATHTQSTKTAEERIVRAPLIATVRGTTIQEFEGALSFPIARLNITTQMALFMFLSGSALFYCYDFIYQQAELTPERLKVWQTRFLSLAGGSGTLSFGLHYFFQPVQSFHVASDSHDALFFRQVSHLLGDPEIISRHLVSLLSAQTVRLKTKKSSDDYRIKHFVADISELDHSFRLDDISAVLEPTERNPSAIPVTTSALKIRPKTWRECFMDMTGLGKGSRKR